MQRRRVGLPRRLSAPRNNKYARARLRTNVTASVASSLFNNTHNKKEKSNLDGLTEKLFGERFPTAQDAVTEIINLEAILRLPKGTEHFLSDLHGEYGAFCHLMNGKKFGRGDVGVV